MKEAIKHLIINRYISFFLTSLLSLGFLVAVTLGFGARAAGWAEVWAALKAYDVRQASHIAVPDLLDLMPVYALAAPFGLVSAFLLAPLALGGDAARAVSVGVGLARAFVASEMRALAPASVLLGGTMELISAPALILLVRNRWTARGPQTEGAWARCYRWRWCYMASISRRGPRTGLWRSRIGRSCAKAPLKRIQQRTICAMYMAWSAA